MSFDKAFTHTVGIEGGYVNDPADRGGETNWGITRETANRYGYTGSMRDLTIEQAKAIYKRGFWDVMGLDAVLQRSEALALELFDTGVNVGTSRAARWLQEALNSLNGQGRHYADIKEDGDIGPKTLAALDGFLTARGHEGLRVLLATLNVLQGAHYVALARGSESQERFLYGWILQRVVNGLREAI